MYNVYYIMFHKGCRVRKSLIGTFDNRKEAEAAGKAVEAKIGLSAGGYNPINPTSGYTYIREA